MNFTLPGDRTASGSVAYVDKDGNKAVVDGTPTMTVSDDSLLELVQSGSAFQLKPKGTLGLAQVTIKADADLGAGVEEVITLIDVEIVGGKAVAGNVTLALD